MVVVVSVVMPVGVVVAGVWGVGEVLCGLVSGLNAINWVAAH